MKTHSLLFNMLLFILLPFQVLTAQKDDPLFNPRKESLGNFTQLKIYSGIIVNLIPSDENKAIIYGDHYGGILLKQKGNTLKVRMRFRELFHYNNTYVDLYFKRPLHVLKLHQGAQVNTQAPLKHNKIVIKAHEGARFDGVVNTELLITKARTGGLVRLEGSTSEHILKVSTGGICFAEDLLSDRTQVSIFAGGEVGVFSDQHIEAHVSMGGNIGIKGKPKSIIARRTFAGEIYSLNQNNNRFYFKRNRNRIQNQFK